MQTIPSISEPSITSRSQLAALFAEAEAVLQESVWPEIEKTCEQCTERVLDAMLTEKLGEEHFYCVTGYGHNDLGRATLDAIWARTFQTEAALVRPHFVSGTHTIATGLRGCLQSGDLLLSLTGPLYDTIEPVLGLKEPASPLSLKGQGIAFETLNPFQTSTTEWEINLPFDAKSQDLIKRAKVLYLQRSRGYSLRPSLRLAQLERLIQQAKAINPHAIVFVDNCYGEFMETHEPSIIGADLLAGSLIKNPGGGLAPTGGYLAGRADLIERAAEALTCPGIGREGGYMAEQTRTLLQGLFLAPATVKEAHKGMILAAWVLEHLGYAVMPGWQEPRADIIQTIWLKTPENLIQFCQSLQAASPVSSYVKPVPSQVPGYQSEVIMAGGSFIEGSSIELSADAPLREPYTLFLQGGLSYAHTKIALKRVLDDILALQA